MAKYIFFFFIHHKKKILETFKINHRIFRLWLSLKTYKYIIIILFLWEFFTPTLADDLPQEFEWQQVSSNLQDSSQYSGWFQTCCSLDGLHSCSYFQFLQSLDEFFGDCTECTNYKWYYCYFHVPSVFTCFQFYSVIYYYYYCYHISMMKRSYTMQICKVKAERKKIFIL